MERGIFTLIAPTSDPSYDTFAAYSNMFQMPLVSPAFPQQTSSDRPSHVGVNLRPRYLKAIVDVINYYKWKTIIYLYDSDNGEFARNISCSICIQWLNYLGSSLTAISAEQNF